MTAPQRRTATRTALRLPGLLPQLAPPLEQATPRHRKGMATRTLLADLALAHRWPNALPLRWRPATRPAHRTRDPCDFAHHPSSKAQPTRLLALGNLDGLAAHRAVRLLGKPGTGQTCVATGVASAACHAKIQGLCPTALDLRNPLSAAAADPSRGTPRHHDATPALLGCDAWGSRSLGQPGSHRFFQGISQRHQRQSPVMPPHGPFADWGKVLAATTVATAIADRLGHHSEGLILAGSRSRSKCTEHPPRRTPQAKGVRAGPSWPPTPFCCRFSSDTRAPVRPHDALAHFQTDDFGLLFGRW
jgi:DNA replication protein DnaC